MNKFEKYSSYKDSGVEWLGEIPEHWEIQKLKFNSKIETGNSISDSQKGNYENIEDESYPYIATKDINYDFSTIDYSNGLRIPINNKNFKISNPDTTLICIEGGSAGKKIAFNTQNICFVNKLASIQSINSNIPKFLYYLTKSYIFKQQFELSMNGLIGGVSISTMKNFELIFPPKEEQTKIASFLDDKTAQIDEVISQKEKLIELLKERKQIVINDAVTKGLDKNVEMIDSDVEWIGKIPKHWNVEKGKRLFQQMKRLVREQDEIVTCFRDGEVTLRTNRRTDGFTNALKEHGYQGIRKGDFVIHNMDAFAGAIGISDSDGKSTPVYSVCRPWDENIVFSEYYARYLRNLALQDFILSLAKGIRERSTDFRFKDFGELEYPVPPKDEQLQIVEHIENQTTKIDKAIELQQNYISKLKEYKASLIDSVVTGKVMVK